MNHPLYHLSDGIRVPQLCVASGQMCSDYLTCPKIPSELILIGYLITVGALYGNALNVPKWDIQNSCLDMMILDVQP